MHFTAKRQKLLIVLFFGLAFALLPFVASAQTHVGFQYVSELGLGTRDLRSGVIALINILLGVLGTIAVVIVMYGGYTYMTSGGDPNKILNARKILINGVVGMVIITSSWGVVALILSFFGIGIGSGTGAVPGISYGTGPRALGSGIVQSHYPGRSQLGVARNTKISITFKESMDASTIISDTSGNGIYGDCLPTVCDTMIDTGAGDSNIKVFKNSDGEVGALLASEVLVSTNDNKTFVFAPVNYLGNGVSSEWYTVRLRDFIMKMDGGVPKPAFVGVIGGIGYEWQFEVSNKVDLTPPKITNVIPKPDNAGDTYLSSTAVQATGSIQVVSVPSVAQSSSAGAVTVVTGGTPSASVSGIYGGVTNEMIVTVTINAGALDAFVDWPGTHPNDNPNATISSSALSLGSGLTFSIGAGFTAGNQWTVGPITAEVPANYLRIGNTNYEFVSSGAVGNQINIGVDQNSTATNIASIIDSHAQISATLSAFSPDTIDIVVTVAGSAGNSIVLSSSKPADFTIVPMVGGVSAGVSQICSPSISDCDQPINAVLQINFDEPIDPTKSTGVRARCISDADCVKYGMSIAPGSCVANFCAGGNANFDNIKIRNKNGLAAGEDCSATGNAGCSSNYCSVSVCVGDNISGTFAQSNNYKTVEFITFDKCGVNSCGEDVYCLPTFGDIEVQIHTSELKACISNADCTDGNYNVCNASSVCEDSTLNLSPQASSPANGIIDMALNSLDGNRDGFAQGPDNSGNGIPWEIAGDYYNENTGLDQGDNYVWDFFTSDKIDLIPPVIESIFPPLTGILNMNDPVEVLFSKLMMGGTLKPDGGYGDKKEHLSIIDNSTNPIGYWVTSKNVDTDIIKDNVVDKTKAYINHTSLISSSSYRARIGEGVKDLYQNCYVPGADVGFSGSTCNTVSTINRFCCNGTPIDPSSLPLDSTGRPICP